jgi:hypothetical protein
LSRRIRRAERVGVWAEPGTAGYSATLHATFASPRHCASGLKLSFFRKRFNLFVKSSSHFSCDFFIYKKYVIMSDQEYLGEEAYEDVFGGNMDRGLGAAEQEVLLAEVEAEALAEEQAVRDK